MISEHDETLKKLSIKYHIIEQKAKEFDNKLKLLNKKNFCNWRIREILLIDKEMSKACHDVLALKNKVEVEIYRQGIEENKEEFKLYQYLLGNVVRLQEYLQSIQRMNTHSYLVFSCIFAIIIATVSLLISILPSSISFIHKTINFAIIIWNYDSFRTLLQIFINGIASASVYFLIAYSFSIIYSIGKVFYFSHGIIITTGAYSILLFIKLGLPHILAICIGIILAAILGMFTNMFIYSPLRSKGASKLVQMLAALGIYIILQNIISMIFGDYTQKIRLDYVSEGMNIFNVKITIIQIVTIGVSILATISCFIFLKLTRIGKAIRAISSSYELSSISGIYCERVIICAFFISSGLAAIAGVLIAWDIDMIPTMGMTYLLMGIVTLIVGGSSKIPGITIGAIILGLSQHCGAALFGSEWQNAIAFIILFIVLVFKPKGLTVIKHQKLNF